MPFSLSWGGVADPQTLPTIDATVACLIFLSASRHTDKVTRFVLLFVSVLAGLCGMGACYGIFCRYEVLENFPTMLSFHLPTSPLATTANAPPLFCHFQLQSLSNRRQL